MFNSKHIQRSELISQTREILRTNGIENYEKSLYLSYSFEEILNTDSIFLQHLKPSVQLEEKPKSWNIAFCLVLKFLADNKMTTTENILNKETVKGKSSIDYSNIQGDADAPQFPAKGLKEIVSIDCLIDNWTKIENSENKKNKRNTNRVTSFGHSNYNVGNKGALLKNRFLSDQQNDKKSAKKIPPNLIIPDNTNIQPASIRSASVESSSSSNTFSKGFIINPPLTPSPEQNSDFPGTKHYPRKLEPIDMEVYKGPLSPQNISNITSPHRKHDPPASPPVGRKPFEAPKINMKDVPPVNIPKNSPPSPFMKT
ncbi:hypothetical protein TRFO_18438 [Tritrichomonas foetus]|uniref:LisH domain-containing protein n=1 Tax=Tritrichomonas foetus TaxID=1144522 RepID=A0A1J4KLY7_9EUKA|nr:hypothetical protein TRFO_18438 [Tritrichomonas foetus]|eukprot:OHT11952.1 hypothetical protein TRFO_18438 [Tritrichomonas foetus]